MELDRLCSELETLFDLDELKQLSTKLLGLNPSEVGGGSAKASFARALVDHCAKAEAVEALADAVVAWRPDVGPDLLDLRNRGFQPREELEAGAQVGEVSIVRKLGESALGHTYLAIYRDRNVRLKLLSSESQRDRKGVERMFTAVRLASAVDHPGLPRNAIAGVFDTGRRGVMHDYVQGELLSDWLQRVGPRRFTELPDLLRQILEPLEVLHKNRLTHGNLKLQNLLWCVNDAGQQYVLLLDPGSNQIRQRRSLANGKDNRFCTLGSVDCVAPEQIRGDAPTPRSDVYAYGAILFQLLTGKAPFTSTSAIEALIGHLTRPPPAVGTLAEGSSIPPEVEQFLQRLLAKDPSQRPADATELRVMVEAAARASMRVLGTVSAEEVSRRLTELLSQPWNEEEAAALEATVDVGADANQLAEGFRWISDQLDPDDGPVVERARKAMLFRAARIYEKATDQPDAAEQLYAHLLELDDSDDSAAAALERVRRKQGKHEDIIEEMLAKSENAETNVERARLMAEIGTIYRDDLGDREQALVAFTQAFCENPDEPQYAEQLARLAGNDESAWGDVFSSGIETVKAGELPTDSINRLLEYLGDWYSNKINRPDLALPMYNQILTTDPANEAALEGLSRIYRKAQQWSELGAILVRRAETAAPAARRDLQAEAAEVIESKLNNLEAARELYDAILSEDPGHELAATHLAALCQRVGDNEGYVRVLERRAASVGGEQKQRALCQVAEAYEDHLNDMAKAAACYEAVLEENPDNLDALKGLDRVYNRQGRYPELIGNLEAQLRLAVTARQKVNLWLRIAGICEEEFLDNARAAHACENALDIDAENDEALTALARYYRALDRWQDVIVIYERHLNLLEDPARRTEKAVQLGSVLADQGLLERAMEAYELALSASPSDPKVLDTLARLRAEAGDAERALEAIEALAEEATSPIERAKQFLRAAELLESRGDSEAALERYKWAVDANPEDAQLSTKLRKAYIAHGDPESAVELLEAEIERTSGNAQKARLSGEMAVLCQEYLRDTERANAAARVALKLDPANINATLVLGHLAFDDEKFVEASKRYQQVVHHAAALEPEQAIKVFSNYIEVLAKTDEHERALGVIDDLIKYAPEDPKAMIRAAEIVFEHGAPHRALELNSRLLDQFGEELPVRERAKAFRRQGESARKMQDFERARQCLEEALDLDPGYSEAYSSLAKVYEDQKDWRNAIGTLYRQQEGAIGDERADVLAQIGDLAAEKLDDVDYAANIYLTALGERPDDRKIMMKLMQLYSQSKDWEKLLSVIMRLADLVDDSKQKAKYLHTASMVASRELQDMARAAELLDQALKYDPKMQAALQEAIKLRSRQGDHESVKELLKLRIAEANDSGNRELLLKSLDELAALYHDKLGRLERAIEVHEEALGVDPNPEARRARLTQLYLEDPHRYGEQALAGLTAMIKADPFQPEPYKAMRRLYTEVRRPDGAYCACQVLVALNRAEPDEVKFYNRMRSDEPAAAQDRITEDDWNQLVMHKDMDPMLTALFVLIEPAVTRARAENLAALGYTEHHRIQVENYPYGCVYALNYAAEVLQVRLPPLYQNTNDPGALNFLHAQTPSIVCGQAATSSELPVQMATFIAARHLSYYRPGIYVRQIVPTAAGLKAWLFAAIKLITPKFPVAKDLEGPVQEALVALDAGLTPKLRDHLAQVVTKLLSTGASLDIKRWIAGADHTVDRAGFILADDLQTAIEVIRAGEDPTVAPDMTERVKDLLAFSVSTEYHGVRDRLRIAI